MYCARDAWGCGCMLLGGKHGFEVVKQLDSLRFFDELK
jgi:hypothetical protein